MNTNKQNRKVTQTIINIESKQKKITLRPVHFNKLEAV